MGKDDKIKMKFAIIPWSKDYYEDRMFTAGLFRDGTMIHYVSMRNEFLACGNEIHTIDYYDSDYSEVDYFLFFIMNWEWLIKLIRMGRVDSLVYCNAEPPSVDKMNTPEGYRIYKLFFPYILTWNDEWIDNKTIFKRNQPYHFVNHIEGALTFSEKKLITFISSNRISDFDGELYSERVKAIDFFEKKIPEKFDFYGFGWDKDLHPCYRGIAEEKYEIFHRYRFAICYENIRGYSGYISEKIFDCLMAGIVPIYAGAPDICKYVPEDSFIALDDFTSYEELLEYIVNITEDEYQSYLFAAKQFIDSNAKNEFTGERYAQYIIAAVNNHKQFKIPLTGYLYLLRRWIYKMRIKYNLE